jgi:hypothetical protein
MKGPVIGEELSKTQESGSRTAAQLRGTDKKLKHCFSKCCTYRDCVPR